MGEPRVSSFNKLPSDEFDGDPRVDICGAKFESITKGLPKTCEMRFDTFSS